MMLKVRTLPAYILVAEAVIHRIIVAALYFIFIDEERSIVAFEPSFSVNVESS